MVCDSQNSTLRYLKSQEALGKYNDVIDTIKFDKLNKELTRYAEVKYDLDFKDNLLFSTRQVETTFDRTSSYLRDDKSVTVYASPNEELFSAIDEAILKFDIAEADGTLEIQNIPDADYGDQIPDPFFTRGKFKANELNRLFEDELKKKLVLFLSGLNIKTDLSADKFLDGISFRKGSPLAAFDLIQKYLGLRENITKQDMLNQSAYIIYSFLGRGSKISGDLWHNIENWNRYDEVYDKWDKIAQENKDDEQFRKELDFELLFLDEEINSYEKEYVDKNPNKNFWAHKQAIIQFISEMLEIGLKQKYIGPKIKNPDINKEYFESIGHKDKFEQNVFKRLLNLLYNWIQTNVFNNPAFKKYSNEDLEELVLDVVDDVYQLKYEKFIRNYYLSEEDGNWYDMNGQVYEIKDYEESINKDPFVAEVIEKLFGHPFIDYALSGSATLRKFGRVIRSVDEEFHDIDGVIKLAQFRKEENALEFLNWIDNRGLPLSQRRGKSFTKVRKDRKIFTKEITPLLEGQSWYRNVQQMFPTWKLLRTFIGKGNLRTGDSVVITGTIEHPTATELVTQENLNGRSPKDIGKVMPKLYLIDFFLRTKEGNYPMQYEGYKQYFKEWKQIMEAKLDMGRGKDLNDLIYFMPVREDQEGYQYRNKGYRYFSFTNENQSDLTTDLTDPFQDEVSLVVDETSDPESNIVTLQAMKNDKKVGKIEYTVNDDYVDLVGVKEFKNKKNEVSAVKMLGITTSTANRILRAKNQKMNPIFQKLAKEGYAGVRDNVNYFVDPYMEEVLKDFLVQVPVDTKAQRKTRGIEIAKLIAKKLALSLNVGYANLSQADAKKLLNSKGKNYNNESAFYWGGTIYTVGDNIDLDTMLHEFAHPFIRAIQFENRKLFDNLYAQLESTEEGRFIINHVKRNYPELNVAGDAFKNEVLTYSLQWKAVDKVTEEVESEGFLAFISKLLFAIRQLFRKVFKTSKVSGINESTTMEELADAFLNENFDLETDLIKNDDIVFFVKNIKDMASDLTKGIASNTLQQSLNELYIGNNLILNKAKNYRSQTPYFKEMLDRTIFREGSNVLLPKAQEILRSYQTVSTLNKNASKEDIILDVVRAEEQRQKDLLNSSRAFINTIGIIDNIAKNIYEDLDAMRKTKSYNQRDAITLLYTYRNAIAGWTSTFEDIDALFRENQGEGKKGFDIKEDNEFFTFVNNVKLNLERADKFISEIYKENNIDIFVQTTSYMNDFLKDRLKKDLMNSLKSKLSEEEISDFFDKAVNRQLTNDDYKALEKKGVLTKYIADFVTTYQQFEINRGKIVDALSGRLKDVGWLNRFIEAYTSSNDPIVGGLAIFIQNIRTEAEQEAIAASYEFRNDLANLLPKIGFNRLKTRQILDMVATKDQLFTLENVYDKDGNLIERKPAMKEVYSFIDRFGNGWRHDLGKLEYELTLAQEAQDKEAEAKAREALYQFKRDFMHDIYVKEIYELDKIFDKYPPAVAEAARQLRKTALDEYNNENNEITNELERFQKYSIMQELWKNYQMLHSLTYEDGTPKVDSPADGVYDLSIAKVLIEYRNASRQYYEFAEKEGSLQTAYDEFINLIDSKYGYDTDEYRKARIDWLKQNTRVAIKQEYFDEKARLISRMKELQDKMKKNTKFNVSELYQEIYDLMYANKDSRNQPVPYELGIEKVKKIKSLQQKIIDIKDAFDKTSGLTAQESTRLSAIITIMKTKPQNLTEENKKEYVKLLQKQTATGLTLEEANELESIYSDLGNLSEKLPTEYYVDAFNSHLQRLGKESLTASEFDDYINTEDLKKDLIADDEFADWFFANHVIRRKFVKGKRGKQPFYIRSMSNDVALPIDESYFDTKTLVDPITKQEFTLEIDGVPVTGNARHSQYRIKREYMTGYNPATGNIEYKVGVHKDNKNRFLPRNEEGSKYLNKEYQKIMAAPNSPRAKLLESMKKHHLKFQENSPNDSKLYLDLPRYILRDNLSVVQSGKLGNKAKQIQENLIQAIRDIAGAKDKSVEDYNYVYDDNIGEYRLVSTTLEGEELKRVPVSGLFDIKVDNVDPDVIQNMMRYMYSLKQQSKLIQTLPIVNSVLDTLQDPDNALKKKKVFSAGAFKTAGKFVEVKEQGRYNRLEQVRSLIEREYEGRKFEGSNTSEIISRLAGRLSSLSARGSLALNIPSDLKNRFGQLMQNYIEAAGGEVINARDYAKGRLWATATMTKWLAKDVYSIGAPSLNYQLVEAFDSVFMTKDKFGRTVTRSFAKDLLNGEWMYMARKNLEMEAALQLFSAFLYSQTVTQKLQNGKTRNLKYIDAWELDKETGVMKLKEGVDPEFSNRKVEHVYTQGESLEELAELYNTTVEKIQEYNGIKSVVQLADGQTITIANSANFKNLKNLFQGMSRRLYGAYDDFGQAEGNKYLGYRLFLFMRKWFFPLMINRVAFSYDKSRDSFVDRFQGRYDWALGSAPIGFYINGLKALTKLISSKGKAWPYLSTQEKIDLMRSITEAIIFTVLGLILTLGFGYDPDDPERFDNMREKSGALGNEDFELMGYLENLSQLLTIGTMQEVTAFIPLPQFGVYNFGLEDQLKIVESTTTVFNNTIKLYGKILQDIALHLTGSEKAYYQQDVGDLWFKQAGMPKIYGHIFKAFGYTGGTADLPEALKGIESSGKLK